jgi:hypothetical protein
MNIRKCKNTVATLADTARDARGGQARVVAHLRSQWEAVAPHVPVSDRKDDVIRALDGVEPNRIGAHRALCRLALWLEGYAAATSCN